MKKSKVLYWVETVLEALAFLLVLALMLIIVWCFASSVIGFVIRMFTNAPITGCWNFWSVTSKIFG